MEPLQIIDEFGDTIIISELISYPATKIECEENTIHITIQGRYQTQKAECVEIHANEAIQIINHLKQCFGV